MGQRTKMILTLIAIPAAGMILLNLTFVLAWAFHTLMERIIPAAHGMASHWLFVLFIFIISMPVLRSSLPIAFKSTFTIVPVATLAVTLALTLYPKIILTFITGSFLYGLLLIYLLKTKKHWLYIYSATLVFIVLVAGELLGMEI